MICVVQQLLLVARMTPEGVAEAEVKGVAGVKHLTGSMIKLLFLVQIAWPHLANFRHLVGSLQQCHRGLS